MPREVSRRTSIPPEQKGKVVRPDMAKTPYPEEREHDLWKEHKLADQRERMNRRAIRRGRDMDKYVGSLNPVEGNLSRSTGYVDNNNGRGGKDAKRK